MQDFKVLVLGECWFYTIYLMGSLLVIDPPPPPPPRSPIQETSIDKFYCYHQYITLLNIYCLFSGPSA